jgi:hypothetical protein
MMHYCYLSRHPRVFLTMMELSMAVFDELVQDLPEADIPSRSVRATSCC